LLKQRIENGSVTEKQKAKVGLATKRDLGPWKRNRGPFVAAHCVKRGDNRCCHAIFAVPVSSIC
jgi:hypothetical protein